MSEQPVDPKSPPPHVPPVTPEGGKAPNAEVPSSVSEANQPAETQDLRRAFEKPAPSKQTEKTLPTSFGRYVVLQELGSGGFGTVYLGHDHQLDRPVAIKAHRSDRAACEEDLQEFLQEARRVAKLHHPGIVAVHDVGIEGDCIYIVSEFVKGVTLRERIRKHPFTWQEAVRIAASMAEALAHAHSLRVVHRDIKPANIILTPDLRPILVDFGLGLDEAEIARGQQRGLIAGTPAYMSPEQAAGQGHRIDGRTDIYALGVVLYELLTGHVPFRAATNEELLRQVCEDEPQPPRQLVPHIPRDLEKICLTALAKRAADRFTTAGDLAAELTKLLTGTESMQRQASAIAEAPSLSMAPAAKASIDSRKSASTSMKRDAERRQLTLLTCICDLFESADFIENLDSEEQHQLLHEYQEACAAVIKECGGTIIQMTEQLTLACFGFPVAYEDAAARAVRTGLGILKAMAALGTRLQRHKGIAFHVAVCVHTGMAVVSDSPEGPGREAFSVVGEARNVITRLDAVIKPDTLVISQNTYRLVQGIFECESLGAAAVKGVAKPIEFFKVVRENEAANRIELSGLAGLTPLVGRDREVGLLQDRWEQAIEGMGQVVLVIGEAGLGKSRLIHVIKEYVTAESEVISLQSPAGQLEFRLPIVEWRCTPQHQNSVLYPVIEYLERFLRFERDQSAEQKFLKLHAHLDALGLATDEITPFLAALLSLPCDSRFEPIALSPVRQKEKTFEAILECLRVFATRQPFLFIVEDLHWMDPSTLELLTMHVESGLHDRILTILTFRPEFETPWKSKAHQTVMALNRLTKKQMTAMMQQKTGVQKLPLALIEQIAAKTDGIPLFVEEYTQMVMESAKLREVSGQVEISGSYLAAEIPATLQDLLMARLDRMASNREVVQIAATLGREFTYDLMRAVAPLDEDDLRAELDKLVAAELLYQKGRPPQSGYVFKHALIQDAAYQSLLKSKKQQVHRRVALALEKQGAALAQNQPELLAHHFTEAALLPQAIDYWTKAGQRSMAHSANAEAASHLRRGLDLLAALPDTPERAGQELGMLIPLGTALIATQGYAAPEVGPIFERARALCEKIGQPTALMAILWGIWAWRVVREELDQCFTLADEMLALADKQADEGMHMETQFAFGLTHFYRGNFSQSAEHCRRGLALYDAERCKVWSQFTGQNAGVTEQCYLALSLCCLGYPDQALKAAQDAVKRAREIAHPYSLCFALHHLGWLQQYLCLGKDVQTSAEAEMVVATEQGFSFWKGTGTLCRACGLLLQGKAAPALEEARHGLELYRATGAKLSLAHYLSYHAEANRQLGQFAEALTFIDEALVASAQNHNNFFLAELHRLKGEILLVGTPNDLAAAEACFEESLAVAAQQQAKWWDLRTTMSLGRLRHAQGRSADAWARLAPLVAWFTEGSTMPDLIEACKLLDEWA